MVMSFLSNSLLYSSLVDDTSSLTVKISFQKLLDKWYGSYFYVKWPNTDHNQSTVAILNNAEWLCTKIISNVCWSFTSYYNLLRSYCCKTCVKCNICVRKLALTVKSILACRYLESVGTRSKYWRRLHLGNSMMPRIKKPCDITQIPIDILLPQFILRCNDSNVSYFGSLYFSTIACWGASCAAENVRCSAIRHIRMSSTAYPVFLTMFASQAANPNVWRASATADAPIDVNISEL